MIRVSVYRDEANNCTVYEVVVPDKVTTEVELDGIDKKVIESPIESTADIFQNLEIIARRYENQIKEERRQHRQEMMERRKKSDLN